MKLTIKPLLAMVLVLLMLVGSLLPTQKAEAHDTYFLNVLIDSSSYEYKGYILHDKKSKFGNESKHTEAALGDFKDFKKESEGAKLPRIPGTIEEHGHGNADLDGTYEMIYSFPAYQQTEGLTTLSEANNATAADYERAKLVSDTLIGSLNGAIKTIWADSPTVSISQLRERTNTLIGAVNNGGKVNGFTIKKGRIVSRDTESSGLKNNDYITVSKGSKSYEFPYQIIKGYRGSSDVAKSLTGDFSYPKDTFYLSWSNLAYQAWYSLDVNKHTTTNVNEIRRIGKLEESLVEFTENTLRGLRDVLGLYAMNDLIYNEGVRDSGFWHYGVMPSGWSENVNMYYGVMFAIAYAAIMLAMAKILVERNLSIMNPRMRTSLMEGVQDLVITAIALVFLMPLMNFILQLNFRLVDIFATMKTHDENLSQVANYSGFMGGVLLQFFYFFVELWVNFTYIIRGIIIAILTIMAPLFVASLAFGQKWKGIFGNAAREYAGHVFMQSFHALILAFLLQTSVMSRGIETAVTLFSLIVLTNFFRSLFFGNGGDMASRLGMTGAAGAVAVGASALKAGTNKRKEYEHKKNQKAQGGSGGYGGSNGGASSYVDPDGYDPNDSGGPSGGGGTGSSPVASRNQSDLTAGTDTTGGADGSSSLETATPGVGGGSLAREAAHIAASKAKELTSKMNPSTVVTAMGVAGGLGYVAAKVGGSASYGMAFGGDQGAMAFNRFHSGSEKPNLQRPGGQGSQGGAGGRQPIEGEEQFEDFGGYSADIPYTSQTFDEKGNETAVFEGGHLSDAGIEGARERQGTQYIEYNKQSPFADQLQQYQDVFEHGSPIDKGLLYMQGIGGVKTNDANNYEVAYNKIGKARLGIKSLQGDYSQGETTYTMKRSAKQREQSANPNFFIGRELTANKPNDDSQDNQEIPNSES